jgi:hypothetical protein
LALGVLPNDGFKRHQVVAHVCDHVGLRRRRKLDRLSGVLGLYGQGRGADE